MNIITGTLTRRFFFENLMVIYFNLSILHSWMLWAKFGWIWPCGSAEDFKNFVKCFIIISPWKWAWPFIWTNLNPLHPSMLVLLKFLRVFFFFNFDSITCINFIVINMLFLQCVFYSLLSLIKNRVCVKGHQNILQASKIIPHLDLAHRL